MLKNKIICCALLLAALVTAGCGVTIKYSLSGASIPPDAKTFSVAYFPNNAPMVEPILSTTLTDALIDKFTRQTRLAQVDEGGDFAFEGEITGYSSTTASVASDDYAPVDHRQGAFYERARRGDVLQQILHGLCRLRLHEAAHGGGRRAGARNRGSAGERYFPGCGLQLVTAMATFREYIASLGAAGAVPEAELDELLGRYEWFALARLVRLRQRGGDPSEDGRLGFAVQDRAAGTAPEVDRERLTALCADDLIDDFLRAGDYRIVAEEGEADDEVKTVADFDDEDDLVTEELAEIYRQQGLNDEACAIYRKLSLRNPEKSVYFAELIDEIASEGKNR